MKTFKKQRLAGNYILSLDIGKKWAFFSFVPNREAFFLHWWWPKDELALKIKDAEKFEWFYILNWDFREEIESENTDIKKINKFIEIYKKDKELVANRSNEFDKLEEYINKLTD